MPGLVKRNDRSGPKQTIECKFLFSFLQRKKLAFWKNDLKLNLTTNACCVIIEEFAISIAFWLTTSVAVHLTFIFIYLLLNHHHSFLHLCRPFLIIHTHTHVFVQTSFAISCNKSLNTAGWQGKSSMSLWLRFLNHLMTRNVSHSLFLFDFFFLYHVNYSGSKTELELELPMKEVVQVIKQIYLSMH